MFRQVHMEAHRYFKCLTEHLENGWVKRQIVRVCLVIATALVVATIWSVMLLSRRNSVRLSTKSENECKEDRHLPSPCDDSDDKTPNCQRKIYASLNTNWPSSLQSTKQIEDQSLLPTLSVSNHRPGSGPLFLPTSFPSLIQSAPPTNSESSLPTLLTNVTYFPGHLTVHENGLLLSAGLTSRVLAISNELVKYDDGESSSIPFHVLPDFGATFQDHRPWNDGGWIYVSNSENESLNQGGVGALTFDRYGNLIDYKMVLTGSTHNCAGGRTPWDSWISCEEYAEGNIWEVDPAGLRESGRITLGSDGGFFEAFAYDIRYLHFYVTEDNPKGPLRRFTPYEPDWRDPWTILKGDGLVEYLMLEPTSNGGGTYRWTTDKNEAVETVEVTHPNLEGLDVNGNELYCISKSFFTLFVLNLDDNTYTNYTTRRGLFNGSPDQLQRVVDSDGSLLYFTEEGGSHAGVHARNEKGQFFTILETTEFPDETTGLAFSPDGKHLYVAYQETGILFDIQRTDGLSFEGKTLNVKYHRIHNGT